MIKKSDKKLDKMISSKGLIWHLINLNAPKNLPWADKREIYETINLFAEGSGSDLR
jgi:hypothetical protein